MFKVVDPITNDAQNDGSLQFNGSTNKMNCIIQRERLGFPKLAPPLMVGDNWQLVVVSFWSIDSQH